jgi:hypothetical protein
MKRRKKELDLSKDLWINPRPNIRAPDRNHQGNIGANVGARHLELADIALGLKKSAPTEKRAFAGARQTIPKAEPYVEGADAKKQCNKKRKQHARSSDILFNQ